MTNRTSGIKQRRLVMKRRVGLLAALLLATAANGQRETSNVVFVGGTEILRVRVASGGYSPSQRATRIQERVNELLGRGPIRPADITVRSRRGEAVVLVKNRVLFTADRATARFNQMTPLQLAHHWAERMRRILPALTQPK